MNNSKLGDIGESIAQLYLESKGFLYVERKYRTRFGEVDLIMLDQVSQDLVFVEVKYRLSNIFGLPYEAVTKVKLTTISRCARCYIKSHYIGDVSWRIDVISIFKQEVTHYKDVLGF